MAHTSNRKAAWVTLLTNPHYLPGLILIHQTLKAANTRYPLVVMATPQLDATSRALITRRGMSIRDIDLLKPRPGTHHLADHDKRFEDTWTKLRVFELVEYDRVVLMDADMLVRKNMDELMDMQLPNDCIAASHVCACNPRRLTHYPRDWIPENCAHTPMVAPDCLANPPRITANSPRPYRLLNSGLVVLTPSLKTFSGIEEFLHTSPLVATFSFPDQDLLSAFFAGRWKPLSYIYNALKTLRHVHPRMWRDHDVKCVHYIMEKPWASRPGKGQKKNEYAVVNGWWWDQYHVLEREMNFDGFGGDQKGWHWINQFVARD
ncbi:hypothetical protein FRB99_007406 [Tulasnella sp. 403]|nr:hypothetical protein FRB99_007406 [Tulasnella sp. 403]